MKVNYQPAAVLLAAFLLQTTLAPHLRIAGVQPDFLLIVVVVYGFLEGPVVGSVCGFFAGLLQDILVMTTLGLNAVSKTVIGYVSGMVEQNIFSENFLLPSLAIFAATVINETIFLAVRATLGEYVQPVVSFRSIILPGAAYNAVLTGLLFPILTRALRREGPTESKSQELAGAFGPTLQRVRK
ncbi:MAG: rod shape-determining protein MreD [Actinobacteria bacterium]|nr:MAG: rod shape-determining protein MreD [Actinomycetota bacterium]